jgi:hypothetical protein
MRGPPAVALATLVLAFAARAAEVALVPVADNTLYQDFAQNSNGAGYLFAGRAGGGGARRALLRFDVAAAIPPGARIESAELTLSVSRSATTTPGPAGLHRLLEAWGEGASNAGERAGAGTAAQPGDATWSHRIFPDLAWSSPGGAFESTASWTGSIGGIGAYTLESTPGLVTDLQTWLDEPESNHGWILLGDEASAGTARRIDSREAAPAGRPSLVVHFALDADQDGWRDEQDNCSQWANPEQADADGNGIGDLCECGDQNLDGGVDVLDLVAINLAIFDPARVTPLCDTNADQRCDVSDIVGANLKIFGAPAWCSRFPRPAP